MAAVRSVESCFRRLVMRWLRVWADPPAILCVSSLGQRTELSKRDVRVKLCSVAFARLRNSWYRRPSRRFCARSEAVVFTNAIAMLAKREEERHSQVGFAQTNEQSGPATVRYRCPALKFLSHRKARAPAIRVTREARECTCGCYMWNGANERRRFTAWDGRLQPFCDAECEGVKRLSLSAPLLDICEKALRAFSTRSWNGWIG